MDETQRLTPNEGRVSKRRFYDAPDDNRLYPLPSKAYRAIVLNIQSIDIIHVDSCGSGPSQ